MSEPLMELRDIEVTHGERVVLDVPHLVLERGESLTVIGPNGAGKSTLLRVLALLEHPTSGRVLYEGARIANGSTKLEYRRNTALVLQEPFLRNASVRENVATGLRFRHVSRNEMRRRSDEWLRNLKVDHLADRNARSLSGGEAQRVSLARAMVLDPDVLLLDEPFGGLDPPTQLSLMDDLRRALDQVNSTIVFVTHNREIAQALQNRLAVMMNGRLLQVGTPEEVFSAPINEEVAAFVGVENLLRGTVDRESEGLATVRIMDGIGVSVVGDYGTGDELVMGIRPEAVILEPVSRGEVLTSALNRLPGRVTDVTPLGALARVSVDCGIPLVSLVTGQSVENLSLTRGREVLASFKASAIHVVQRIPQVERV